MQRDSKRHCRRVTWEASCTTLTESSACEFLFSRPPETHSYYFGQGECKRAGICCQCFFFQSRRRYDCGTRTYTRTYERLCASRAQLNICCSRDFFAPSAIISELNGIEKRQGKKLRFFRSRVSARRVFVFTVLLSNKSIKMLHQDFNVRCTHYALDFAVWRTFQ